MALSNASPAQAGSHQGRLRRRARRGFTLIEILIVIVIISLLAAILFPVFGRARESARRSSCHSNLRQISLAFAQYTQDFDERLPNRKLGNVDLHTRLQNYIRSKQVYECPSQTTSTQTDGTEKAKVANTRTQWNFWSYAMSGELTDAGNPMNISYIPYPSRMVLVGEIRGNVDRSYPQGFADARFWPGMRHLDGVNLVFVDGHVKWFNDANRGLYVNSAGKTIGSYWEPTEQSP